MSENNEPITFGIIRVKEFSFTINESLGEVGKLVRIQFQHHTNYYDDRNSLDLTLRVIYTYDVNNIPPDVILLDIHVQNVFSIPNLGQYLVNGTGFILPQDLIVSMVSISISHARALLAQHILGTVYEQNILPLINPVEVAKAFYPLSFPDQPSKTTITPKKKRIIKKGVAE